jgi:hypothetical protein
VDAVVSLEVSASSKPFAAIFANIGFLACVDACEYSRSPFLEMFCHTSHICRVRFFGGFSCAFLDSSETYR